MDIELDTHLQVTETTRNIVRSVEIGMETDKKLAESIDIAENTAKKISQLDITGTDTNTKVTQMIDTLNAGMCYFQNFISTIKLEQ